LKKSKKIASLYVYPHTKKEAKVDNKQRVQIKFNQYCGKYQGKDLNQPEYKLFREMSYGILRSSHVHLTRIGSSLEEPIRLKKTCKRFSYHLGKEDLYKRLTETHISANRYFLSRCRYLVVDGGDITKPCASKMEGLGRVYDGSKDEVLPGYWQLNLIGVNPETSSTVMASSRLYSYETEQESPDLSENGLILESLECIDRHINNKQIVVIDRGGDRRILIEKFLTSERPFIIRQTGKRHVEHQGRRKRVDTVGKSVLLKYKIHVTRNRGGRRVIHPFLCGAVRVKFPYEHNQSSWKNPLWLVVVRREGKGLCYFLCSIAAKTAEQAVQQVMEGYGCRWRIEEVHRQVKQDYQYESISLKRYTALRNFNILFWMTMGFLYQQLEDISLQLILNFKEPIIYTGRLRNLGDFYLYKLSRVVSGLLFTTNIRGPANNQNYNPAQIELCIQ
jgi:hypothetical protein